MKYFTPELLAHCRSLDDDAAEAAAEEWERRIATYQARLQEIRQDLPLGAKQLLKHVSLHDAQLLTITRTGKDLFLTFRLPGRAGQPAGGLELRYSLSGPSRLVRHGSPAPPDQPSTRWVLYEELARAPAGRRPAFTHALLLTGGLELRIRFDNLRLRRFARVLPADSGPAEIEQGLADDGRRATA
jgi:hypothetical protein